MAKQVVIETYSFSFYAGLDENGNKKFRPRKTPRIKITYHYDFDADQNKKWKLYTTFLALSS